MTDDLYGKATTPPPPLEVLYVLDETGSMMSIRDDVIGGFNAYLATLREKSDPLLMSVMKFDTAGKRWLCRRARLADVPTLSTATYCPGQSTNLFDAVGDMIASHEQVKLAVLVIHTDGQENSSREWNRDRLRAKIVEKQAQGWQVLFLGAGIDAWADATSLGVAHANSFARRDTRTVMGATGQSVNDMRDAYGRSSGASASVGDLAKNLQDKLRGKTDGQ